MANGLLKALPFRHTHHARDLPPPLLRRAPFGRRRDGTPKGRGFFGLLRGPDGRTKTEFTVGLNINGKEMDVPTLVPTLTRKERNAVVNMKHGDDLPHSVMVKAREHAVSRLSRGLSPFYD